MQRLITMADTFEHTCNHRADCPRTCRIAWQTSVTHHLRASASSSRASTCVLWPRTNGWTVSCRSSNFQFFLFTPVTASGQKTLESRYYVGIGTSIEPRFIGSFDWSTTNRFFLGLPLAQDRCWNSCRTYRDTVFRWKRGLFWETDQGKNITVLSLEYARE